MRKLSVAVVFCCFTAASALAESRATSQAPSITPTDLQARRESGTAPVVIDVRTPEEYAAGHIPGAPR